MLEAVEDDAPPTMRVLPTLPDDSDALERSLIEMLRMKHVEIMHLRRQLAELVRSRHSG
jgi:hypothetical protein